MSGETGVVVRGAAAGARGPGRPANVLALIGTRSLPERADRIRELHSEVGLGLAQTALKLILCGFELHAARAQIGHGQWEKWVADNCPFSTATAWRYLRAAEAKYRQVANLAHVQDLALVSDWRTVPKEQRQALMEAVSRSVDGQTVRQLYLDLGIVCEPRLGGGTGNGQRGSPADRVDAAAAAARSDWHRIAKALATWCSRQAWRHLSQSEQTAAREILSGALSVMPPAPRADGV